ncbi:hypothetical protein GEMRC1_001647 [Eukaryota sp. GEM-RC1]
MSSNYSEEKASAPQLASLMSGKIKLLHDSSLINEKCAYQCSLPQQDYVGKLTTDLVDDIVDQCQSRMLATNGNGSSVMTTFHGDHKDSSVIYSISTTT